MGKEPFAALKLGYVSRVKRREEVGERRGQEKERAWRDEQSLSYS